MVNLPTFDVTDSQRQRIVAALRDVMGDSMTAEATLYKKWLRGQLLEVVKNSEGEALTRDYESTLRTRQADIDLSLGGLS